MRKMFVCAAMLAAVACQPARAGTVIINPAVDYGQLSWVNLSFDSGQNFQGFLAGQMRILRTGGTETRFTLDEFLTWCVEPTEYLAAGPLDFLPLSAGNSAQGGMGAAKARDIARLMKFVHPDVHAAVDKDIGAAIQLAIWEIVRETSSSYGLGSGSFRATGPDAVTAAAEGYLSGMGGARLYNLDALVAAGRQDLLVQTPAPGMVALFGLSLATLAGFRRRG